MDTQGTTHPSPSNATQNLGYDNKHVSDICFYVIKHWKPIIRCFKAAFTIDPDHFVNSINYYKPLWVPCVVSTCPLWKNKNIHRQPAPFWAIITLNPLISFPKCIKASQIIRMYTCSNNCFLSNIILMRKNKRQKKKKELDVKNKVSI